MQFNVEPVLAGQFVFQMGMCFNFVVRLALWLIPGKRPPRRQAHFFSMAFRVA